MPVSKDKGYLISKYRLLQDFGIPVTPEIKIKLQDLYPNEVAIENYTKSLIKKRLIPRDEL